MSGVLNPNLHNPQLNGEPFFWQAGPVGILLLHGFTATPVEVRSAAERLRNLGYTAAGPLLPGHASEPADLNRARWQDWVAAGEASYQALREQCQQVVIGGESMGAVTALYLATQHPEAAAVLAFAPAVRLRLTAWQKLQMRLMANFVEGVPKGRLDASERWQGYKINPLKGVLQLLALQRALLARLHLIRQPVFVAQGRFDATIAPQAGQIVLDGVSSVVKTLRWYERSSHVILIDQELDEAIADVDRFLKDNLVVG